MTHQIIRQTLDLVVDVGMFIKQSRQAMESLDVHIKPDRSLVTSIDVASEAKLIEGLTKIIPTSNCIAEESQQNNPLTDYTWIIDPIDGTTNFVHNFPMYCISVGLYHEGKAIMGIIYEVNSEELYYAHEDEEGAYLNKNRIYVSKTATLSHTLLATGFPSVDLSRLDFYLSLFKKLMERTQGIRRLGSAAMDLAYVACGRCDGFYEYGLSPWDVAGGAYLVQKAGGYVSNFSGGDDYLFGREIIATNGLFHKELEELFKEIVK